jgi:hypothetical protein
LEGVCRSAAEDIHRGVGYKRRLGACLIFFYVSVVEFCAAMFHEIARNGGALGMSFESPADEEVHCKWHGELIVCEYMYHSRSNGRY